MRKGRARCWPSLDRCTVSINIDHHISNSFFGDYKQVEPERHPPPGGVGLLQRLEQDNVPIATAICRDGDGYQCFQYGSTTRLR